MNRAIRTNIPSLTHQLQTTTPPDDQTKIHYDKSAKPLPELDIHDNIRFREGKTWCRKGKIIAHDANPRSYHVLTDKNTIIRRNRRHLLPTSEPLIVEDEIDYPEITNDQPQQPSSGQVSATPLINDPNLQITDMPLTTQAKPIQTTRYGRVIRKPARYT